MCEINPKRKQIFLLEFFTSEVIANEEWKELVYIRLLRLEQAFNESGKVRVHVHEAEEKPKPILLPSMVVKLAPSGEEGIAFATVAIVYETTVVVWLDPRFYKADGNDDGIREVPIERVTPVEL